jgi:diguanylate cyclase (GGDEF)-like protein/PAS domain S-box-containing protein
MNKDAPAHSSTDGASPIVPEMGLHDDLVQRAEVETTELASSRLLHELQVHQIELELQNEQLIETRNAAEKAAASFAELYDFAPVGYVTLNLTGNITRSNLAASKLLRMDRQQLQGKRLATFVVLTDLPKLNSLLSLSNIENNQPVCEIILEGKNARTIQMDISVSDNDLEYLLVLTDITERKEAEVKLQLAASVFTHTHEGIMITDASGTILKVNDAFSRITGFARLEAVGKSSEILQSDHQSPEFYASIQQILIEKDYWYGEVWNRRKNGDIYPEMQAISVVRDITGKTQHYVSLFTDITNLKAHQQQLEHAANFDALTNLPNRALLADRLPIALLQCQRHSKMLAVVYIDLDGFKEINDTYGHDMGDQLLISISQHMSDALRECDTLARIGGDEFVAVLADLETPNDCKPVLDRLQKAAAQTISLGDVLLNVSASMGVSIYPTSGNNADLLLRQADQAMYIAKVNGKDRYHFFDINSGVEARILCENIYEVRHAFAQGEFVLHYQPKINMRSLRVVGTEALIRWRHPEKGLLEPSDFLPFIENHPIRIELGRWVINTALTQLSQWYTQGLDLPVSVNVGAYQLQDKNFFEQLTTALAAHQNVKPGQLELEILETSALENMTHVSSLISACKKVGVSFSLDDFGTGYSSLTYLKRLPSASLKIDQSFVQDMLTNPDDMAIVQGVIGLAEVFGRSVIAEGVESAAHGAKLLSMNCEIGQGYGIARPMPAADLPLWVQNWNANPTWKA